MKFYFSPLKFNGRFKVQLKTPSLLGRNEKISDISNEGSNLIFRFNSAGKVPVLDPEDEGNRILRNIGNTLPNDTAYRSLNTILAQSKICPFGANTTIERKSIATTSHNTGTLPSQNAPRQLPLFSDIVVILFSSIVVLTPNRLNK